MRVCSQSIFFTQRYFEFITSNICENLADVSLLLFLRVQHQIQMQSSPLCHSVNTVFQTRKGAEKFKKLFTLGVIVYSVKEIGLVFFFFFCWSIDWIQITSQIDTNLWPFFKILKDKSVSGTSCISLCFLKFFLCFLQLNHLRILKDLITKPLLFLTYLDLCEFLCLRSSSDKRSKHYQLDNGQKKLNPHKMSFNHFLLPPVIHQQTFSEAHIILHQHTFIFFVQLPWYPKSVTVCKLKICVNI